MFEPKSTSLPIRRALTVGVYWNNEPQEKAQDLLDELNELSDTLGVEVVGQTLVKLIKPQSRLLVGSGKAEEIIAFSREKKADVIIFDQPITPAQQRNWEKLSGKAVIDREQVILDIFARRARTREARLQIDLAQMEYSLPRLTRAWEHLSRQGGSGSGAMGEGETQLEIDRRLVRNRIDRLKSELSEVRLQRATQRKQRQKKQIPHGAIVGYTNAGKSSLFRKLTAEEVIVEDKLFSTLDTTTRKVELTGGTSMLLTDTVGFVRNLPTRLVESFKATLEESVLAHFLIHVLDINNEDILTFHKTTMDILEELGANIQNVVTVFNKIDACQNRVHIASLGRQFPDAVFISAHTGEGLEELQQRMLDASNKHSARHDFLIPQSRYDLVSGIHRHGKVLAESYEGDNVRLSAVLPPNLFSLCEPYLVGK